LGANVTYLEEPLKNVYPVDVGDDLPYTPCDDGERRSVSNCGYDWAGKVLKTLLPNIKVQKRITAT
jgi:hypothetical protein